MIIAWARTCLQNILLVAGIPPRANGDDREICFPLLHVARGYIGGVICVLDKTLDHLKSKQKSSRLRSRETFGQFMTCVVNSDTRPKMDAHLMMCWHSTSFLFFEGSLPSFFVQPPYMLPALALAFVCLICWAFEVFLNVCHPPDSLGKVNQDFYSKDWPNHSRGGGLL